MPADPFAALLRLPGVAEAAETARARVDQVLRHRMLRQRSVEVTAEVNLHAARASAALDGAQVSLDELRSGPADPRATGALRVCAELGGLAATWQHAPRQALARLHVLAARGLTDDEALGRPRAAEAVTARLGGLLDLLAEPSGAPAVVVSAVVHGELLAVRPFAAANGVVARGAARLVLISRGLDPKAVVAPEVGHLELEDGYRGAAEGYAAGAPEQVAGWLRHCAEAVALGAREGVAVCEALQRG